MDFLMAAGTIGGIIFLILIIAYANAIRSVNKETKDKDR
jgi:hypothetical protein